jgi:hypothetical protein
VQSYLPTHHATECLLNIYGRRQTYANAHKQLPHFPAPPVNVAVLASN